MIKHGFLSCQLQNYYHLVLELLAERYTAYMYDTLKHKKFILTLLTATKLFSYVQQIKGSI